MGKLFRVPRVDDKDGVGFNPVSLDGDPAKVENEEKEEKEADDDEEEEDMVPGGHAPAPPLVFVQLVRTPLPPPPAPICARVHS